jgi:RNA polymerase sigma-70 factor (ECF subfamily)
VIFSEGGAFPKALACGTSARMGDAQADRVHLSQLLADVAGGDQAAFAELYERTSAKLFGICLRILKDRNEAEDILQDVYVNVWRSAGRFDSERASPITWLAVLARNRAIDRLRAQGPRPSETIDAALDIADVSEDAPTGLERRQDAARLAHCLGELEDKQRAVIRSAFFDGFTYSELAARLDVPLGTMKSWIRRGLMRLRECLER